MHYDVDAIRAGLTPYAVIASYRLDVKRGGRDEVEARACPDRADHRGRAFVLNTTTGLWRCFPCNTGGDLIELVMRLERKDFAEALPIVAQLAGVQGGVLPSAAELERRAREQAEAQAKRKSDDAQRRLDAIVKATRAWDAMTPRHVRGREYLATRRLEAMAFPALVRYDWNGDPAQALYTADGQVVNVVTRSRQNAEPKVRGLKDCPTAGTFVHALRDLGPDGRNAVIVEGWADSLTAAIAFRGDCRVLGVHGASNMERVAKAAAPRVLALGGRMYVVPHNDNAGEKATEDAVEAALGAGLAWRDSLRVVNLGEHKDLNDAWRASWQRCFELVRAA